MGGRQPAARGRRRVKGHYPTKAQIPVCTPRCTAQRVRTILVASGLRRVADAAFRHGPEKRPKAAELVTAQVAKVGRAGDARCRGRGRVLGGLLDAEIGMAGDTTIDDELTEALSWIVGRTPRMCVGTCGRAQSLKIEVMPHRYMWRGPLRLVRCGYGAAESRIFSL